MSTESFPTHCISPWHEDWSSRIRHRYLSLATSPFLGLILFGKVKRVFLFAECELEKASLSERQARAQSEVTLRRGQVDTISTRLSSLARLHKTLVGNQAHTQASLETLRTQLVAISKFVNTSSKWQQQSFQQSFLNFSLQKPSSKKP